MARKNVKLSVGRGEKVSVKRGAGLLLKVVLNIIELLAQTLKRPLKILKTHVINLSVLEVKAGKVSVVRRLVGAGVVVKQKALVYPQMSKCHYVSIAPKARHKLFRRLYARYSKSDNPLIIAFLFLAQCWLQKFFNHFLSCHGIT